MYMYMSGLQHKLVAWYCVRSVKSTPRQGSTFFESLSTTTLHPAFNTYSTWHTQHFLTTTPTSLSPTKARPFNLTSADYISGNDTRTHAWARTVLSINSVPPRRASRSKKLKSYSTNSLGFAFAYVNQRIPTLREGLFVNTNYSFCDMCWQVKGKLYLSRHIIPIY